MTRRRPLPRSLRLAAALAVLVLPACGGETPAAPAGTDWIVDAGADTTGAAAALGAFADGSVADAFARLAAQPYRVRVRMADLAPGGDRADTLGVYERTLAVAPGPVVRVIGTAARGSLADTAGLDPARLLPRDPFPDLLPDALPFLDPRTRGAYRLRLVPTNLGPQAVVEVADGGAARPLVRSAVVWDQVGARRTLALTRASASAIYDERSAATVELRRGLGARPGAELPHRAETSVDVATPLRRRHLVTEWTIAPQPATTNRREP